MLKWLRKHISREQSAATPAADLGSREMHHSHTIKRQGDEHAKAGRYADAERCYRQVTGSDADYAGSLVMLGFVLREQGRVNEAREVLEHAVRIAGEDADSHYLLGRTLEATEHKDAEIFHLQRAIELRPDFELARSQLVAALLRSDQSARATQVCEDGLATLPGSSELHLHRSKLYVRAGDKASAIASCERALALNPACIAAQQT